MLELGSSGSARGVCSNVHPYRDPPIRRAISHRLQSAESGRWRDRDLTARSTETGPSPHHDNFVRLAQIPGLDSVWRWVPGQFQVNFLRELIAPGEPCPPPAVSPRSWPPMWRAIRA